MSDHEWHSARKALAPRARTGDVVPALSLVVLSAAVRGSPASCPTVEALHATNIGHSGVISIPEVP
jgi:hypothetical protein